MENLDEAELKRQIKEAEKEMHKDKERKRDKKSYRKEIIDEFKTDKKLIKRTGTQDAADRAEASDMRIADKLLKKM